VADLLYASVSDLYDHGVPHGSIANRGRTSLAANAATDAIALGDHGFSTDDEITVRPDAGGTLPSPLGVDTSSYASPVNAGAFKVAATPGGAVIDLTSNGSRFVVVAPIPYEAAIYYASRLIDEMLVGHVLIEDGDEIPPMVRLTCAEIAAGKLALRSGHVSKSLGEIVDVARKRLESWAKGRPLRSAVKPASANLAASATLPYRDTRGWGRYGGIE
jgi:hypothetical protein